MNPGQPGALVLAHEGMTDGLSLSGVEPGAAQDRTEGQCHKCLHIISY